MRSNLFWIFTALLFIINLFDINSWSKLGLNIDNNKSKVINRGFNDSTTLLVVFYGLLYLIILFFNELDNNVMKHDFVIIGFFVMTVVFELFTYISIFSAKKDTAELLKSQNKKSK